MTDADEERIRKAARDAAGNRNGHSSRHPDDGPPEDERGDAWEPPQEEEEGRFRFDSISLKDLLSTDYKQEYLIEDVIVAKQPLIIGAQKKTLKTTLMCAASISLASGLPFLGKWGVKRPVRVGIMSAESGEATIKETIARIIAAMDWKVPAEDVIRLCFRVPRFGDPQHMGALEDFIEKNRLEMLWVDPSYQAIPAADNASNIFAVGALLAEVTAIGQKTGCTMGLLHHLRKNLVDAFKPAELEDLAWSAFGEWARQWVLIGRREKFDPESNGEHRLWLTVGGSAGHCSLWALDVEEGRIADPGGRHWKTELHQASAARREVTAEKEAAKAQREAATAAVNEKKAIEAMRQFPAGGTIRDICDRAGFSGTVFGPILQAMLNDGRAIKCRLRKGNKQEYDGFILRSDELF